VASWLGVYFIQTLTSRTPSEAGRGHGCGAGGVVFAAGIALLAYIQTRPNASQAGLSSFIFGQAAAIVERDVQLVALVGLAAFGVLARVLEGVQNSSPSTPSSQRPTASLCGALNLALSTLIVVAVVLGLQLAGVILMVGLLIAPGIAARQWTHHLGQMVTLAGGVRRVFSGGVGAIFSALDRKTAHRPDDHSRGVRDCADLADARAGARA
jgi:manganese/zinc/iron transport system permease protein